ncbi:2-oxoglutarate and iron-dependent oxygenase domain-containing protein 3 [Tachyglossus aculeatus]|uniref:2-oxoglutarate and iron-dependent oxygenase domain-containing protein 3 n=1 Tax=Tachyglossus aculeatus TaxID=9261 RepID=UPI0018F51D1F|nr:2-oxoglutarate and iron-dependent oxygenase domain-containing protein 3 [Tachyglossus aculeatus]
MPVRWPPRQPGLSLPEEETQGSAAGRPFPASRPSLHQSLLSSNGCWPCQRSEGWWPPAPAVGRWGLVPGGRGRGRTGGGGRVRLEEAESRRGDCSGLIPLPGPGRGRARAAASPQSGWPSEASLPAACPGCPRAPGPAPDPRPPGAPMAPQRRGGPRAPDGGAPTAERERQRRRRPSSVKKGRLLQESLRQKWLKAAFLGSSAILGGLLLWSCVSGDDGVTEVLAQQSEVLQDRFIEVPCSEDYDSHKRFEGCTPRMCGRGVTDTVITREEAERIRRIAERGLALGGSDGGASILDLHSGALSVGKHFVNLYRYFGDKIQEIFSEEDFQIYREARQKIQHTIARAFGLRPSSMYLTKPTFFSRINNTAAKTTHDEYWHPHIDKVTYGSFDYTSLLYLSDYTEDFGGGRFVFMDEGANRTVEPRAGRISFFTSGSENLHRVEKVRWGTRFAITISFTCNPDHGIGDPAFT